MPDTKITALTALTAADPANDVLPIVDVSDTTMAASGTTKKISINNVLGCSGTATLASATITGNLTVDTNTFFVDSANNRVGVNTASPATDLEVRANGNAEGTIRLYSAIDGSTASPKGSYFSFRSGSGSGTETARLSSLNRFANVLGGDFSISTADTSNVLQNRLTIDSGGVFTFAVGGSTAMTLNSTGLGVGVSPSYKLDVQGADNSIIAQFGGTNRQVRFVTAANGGFDNANFIVRHDSSVGGFLWQNNNGSNTLLTIDSSGNVGIGGTPSAKLHVVGGSVRINDNYQLEFGGTNNVIAGSNANNTMNIYTNNVLRVSAKANGQFRFIPLAADPAGAEAGDVYYNSTSNKLKCYNGTTWNDLF